MAQKRSSVKGNKGKYHIEMSSLSLFFWGFCLCFLLAWVFVLGVLVGRGFLPSAVSTISDLKAQMSKMQGLVPHSKTPAPPETQKIENDPKLAFYEKLSSKKEEVKKKPQEEKPAERKEIPSPSPKPVEKASSDPVGVQYTVQVAALEERTKAEGMVSRLKGSGFDAYFNEVKIKGKTFYRIRCGKFRTKEEAGVQAKRLTERAGIKGFVSKFD
jgi:cell division septation protein DedD